MDYFDRFKERMRQSGVPYAPASDVRPNRPLEGVASDRLAAVNQLVDLMIGCRIKGIDFESTVEKAKAWADFEWEMVEPALAAKRASAQREAA